MYPLVVSINVPVDSLIKTCLKNIKFALLVLLVIDYAGVDLLLLMSNIIMTKSL